MDHPAAPWLYLAWIASDLGSAASASKGDMIPQKTQREEGHEGWPRHCAC